MYAIEAREKTSRERVKLNQQRIRSRTLHKGLEDAKNNSQYTVYES